MSKQIAFDDKGREGLKRGVDILTKAVKVTLGARGRNVVIKNGQSVIVTKDGVTVAKQIELDNPLENMGAQMVKEVASKTNDQAGDGTTTATVLAQAILNEGLKNITAGANPMELKRGIDLAVEAIVLDLGMQSQDVKGSLKKIRQIAAISANNDDEIGTLISKAFKKVGAEGVITVEESKGTDTYVEVVEGMEFNKGYLSPYFVTNADKMLVEMENPYILMYDKKVMNINSIMPILEPVSKSGRPLLIIAEDMDENTIGALVMNKLRGGLKIAVVKAPGFGDSRRENLEDIAILTGGMVVSDEKGVDLKGIDESWLGQAKTITISAESTTIVEGAGSLESIEERKDQLKVNIDNATGDFNESKLRERLAKLSGGVAVLYVGAASELEMGEKKARVQDALHATRAAVEEGIVAGGGLAFILALKALETVLTETEDEKTGVNIIRKAVQEPLRAIVENAGMEPSVILNRVSRDVYMSKGIGYDVKRKEYVNMIEEGIVDPKKVTRVALQNAASVASMILTTACVIVDSDEGEAVPQMGGMPSLM